MEFEILKKIVAEVMKVDPREVKPETTFILDLGADSLDILRIIMCIEEQFSISLPRTVIYDINTVEDALNVIKNHKS